MKSAFFWLLTLAACCLRAMPVAAGSSGVAPAVVPEGAVRLAQPNAARFPEVTVYAYPTDARGALISGLGATSFQVLENGLPAEVLRVQAEGGFIDVCLALDRSPSMIDEDKLAYARAAAREFVAQLAAEDRAALITFSDGATLDQGLTRDREALLAAVNRAAPSGNTTTFFDAVYWSITQVALRPHGPGSVVGAATGRSDARRVVVALTDGQDLTSRISAQELVSYARANGVSLCMVALGSDAATFQLDYLARQTGGLYLRAPSPRDLARLYASLAEQLRKEYRITFRSPRPERDGTRRAVKVTLSSAPVSGETWYQAPGQGSLVVTTPSDPGSGQAVGSAAAGSLAAGAPEMDRRLIVGAVLIVVGATGLVAALLLWMGMRRRRLAIVDSNPRMDLLPLWVRQGTNRVGRGPECELVLDSRQVSRVHARIVAAGGAFHLFDEGSSNGTWVNGRRVRRERELRVGDVVRFGDREFRFAGELPA
jgi:VWFA-related protein